MHKEYINWYIVDKKYIDYLKRYDNKVQNIEYKKSSKPYIGIVFKVNNFNYYVPISSPKQKHYLMNENTDFLKIDDGKKILSVINLNNLVPILDNEITLLKYEDISHYFQFKDKKEEQKYVALLNIEKNLINKKIDILLWRAKKLYSIKYNKPNSKIAHRTCDFKLLEEKCIEYSRIKKILKKDKFIDNEEVLFFIYESLENNDKFENIIQYFENKGTNIKNLSKEEINNIARKIIIIYIFDMYKENDPL